MENIFKLFLKITVQVTGAIIIFWIALSLYAVVNRDRYIAKKVVPTQSQYDVVAFGDSLVEGLGASNLNGFVTLLEQDLGIAILNSGHRGDEAEDLLKRIDRDVFAFNPKVVILIIGGNDAIHLVPEDEFLNNMDKLFKQLTDRGIRVIYGEVTDNVFFPKRNQKLHLIADYYGVTYIPELTKNVFWTFTKKSDLLHPNDAGYQIMKERIKPHLLNFLK